MIGNSTVLIKERGLAVTVAVDTTTFKFVEEGDLAGTVTGNWDDGFTVAFSAVDDVNRVVEFGVGGFEFGAAGNASTFFKEVAGTRGGTSFVF